MTIQVILDTDIGTDVDDLIALSLLLCSPEVELVGVTCVYGDVLLRARMVRKLLALRDRPDIPVMAGASKPLLGLLPIYWEGHEGEGLLEAEDERLAPAGEHAVDYLVRTVLENPGRIHLLAIGPLTNVAMAFQREPDLAEKLAHLTIMGGVVRGPEHLDLPYVEHNIRCDPEAAHVVFTSGAPITLIPLDVTTRVLVRRQDIARIRQNDTPFHRAVADQIVRYPRFSERGETFLHDPLAAATVFDENLVTLTPLHVDVELQGRMTAGSTLMRKPTADAPVNAQVALQVDAERFETLLAQRLEHCR
jgi:purine nucleosidase